MNVMSHQINFYLTPSDVEALEIKLGNAEQYVVLHSRSKTNHPFALNRLDYVEGDKSWLYFYLVRPEDVNSVVMRNVPTQDYWTVDVVKSPVVEFNKSFFDGKILRRGRVYYTDSYYDANGGLQSKGDEFIAWAKKMLNVTKRNLQKVNTNYIGLDAKAWLETKAGKLSQ